MTPETLRAAARHLGKSSTGRNAMTTLLRWFDADGLSLDAQNKQALVALLAGAWGSHTGTTRDEMEAAMRRR